MGEIILPRFDASKVQSGSGKVRVAYDCSVEDIERLIADAYKEGYQKGYLHGKEIAMKWIPVTDKLPVAGVDVLCFDDESIYIGWLNCDRDWTDGEYADLKVKAWMPLPKPYRGE